MSSVFDRLVDLDTSGGALARQSLVRPAMPLETPQDTAERSLRQEDRAAEVQRIEAQRAFATSREDRAACRAYLACEPALAASATMGMSAHPATMLASAALLTPRRRR
jgi:hypothetical protein